MEWPKITILATVPCQLECVINNFSSHLNKLEWFCTCSYFAVGEWSILKKKNSFHELEQINNNYAFQ